MPLFDPNWFNAMVERKYAQRERELDLTEALNKARIGLMGAQAQLVGEQARAIPLELGVKTPYMRALGEQAQAYAGLAKAQAQNILSSLMADPVLAPIGSSIIDEYRKRFYEDVARQFYGSQPTTSFFTPMIEQQPQLEAIKGFMNWLYSGALPTDNYLTRREKGGKVQAGIPYLVGEKGAEVFVPETNGTIVPNSALPKQGKTEIDLDKLNNLILGYTLVKSLGY